MVLTKKITFCANFIKYDKRLIYNTQKGAALMYKSGVNVQNIYGNV